MAEELELIEDIYRKSMSSGRLVLDVETTGLDWIKDDFLGIGLCASPSDAWWVDNVTDNFKEFLTELFKIDEITFVFQNAKFDLHFLKRFGVPENVEDTMLMAQLIHENMKHDLYSLTENYLTSGHNNYTNVLRDYRKENKLKSFTGIPSDLLGRYCMEQCLNTLELYEIFSGKIVEDELCQVYHIERLFLKNLLEMETAGMLIDDDYLLKLRYRFEKEANEVQAEFPEGMNLNSPPQVRDYLTKLGVQPVAFTQKGSPSWSKEALALVEHPEAKKIVRYRYLMHTIATFIDSYLEIMHHGRIHCNFRQIGADTGRMSCVNPNLQQVPRGPLIRKAFIGRENIVVYDYKQMEARLFGHEANDAKFIEICRTADDIYADFAKQLFKVEDPLAILVGDRSYRNVTKGIFLGIIYGMGDEKLREIIGTASFDTPIGTPNSSNFSVDEEFSRYFNDFKQYRNKVEAYAKEHGYVKTLLGRRRHISAAMLYKAVNSIIQGSAADVLKIVMVALPSNLRKKLRLPVHDSLVFEDLENAEIKEAKEIMCDFNLRIPLVVSCGVGANWADAEANYDG